MTAQATLRAALASMIANHPEGAVTVGYKGESCDGFIGTKRSRSALSDYGQNGATTDTVSVSAADLTEPMKGETITIDGEVAFVMEARVDGLGAVLTIDYQDQRVVEGI